MAKIAVDIVLLPSDEVTNKVIDANRQLSNDFNREIILNKKDVI